MCVFLCAPLLHPANIGWAVGACVVVLALCLLPAIPGSVVLCGWVCLGLGFGCAPPLVAGCWGVCVVLRAKPVPRQSWLGFVARVSGFGLRLLPRQFWRGSWGVCVCVRAPPVARQSWLACAVWLCLLVFGVRLRPAIPGSGLWCVGWVLPGTCSPALVRCVLCALPGFTAPGGRCWLAPVRVPWLWPVACLLGVPRGACVVCRALSGPVALGSPVSIPVALVPSPTGGQRPPIYWAAAWGSCRVAQSRAHGDGRWPLPRHGRWARSGSYPFGAPRSGCPWRVPAALVLGCVRCGDLACVDPVNHASGVPYRPSLGGGLGWCTRAVSSGRRDLPFPVAGRHARVLFVCACVCPLWPGRAGRPPGRVLVRLTFSLAVVCACFVSSAFCGLRLPCFCFFPPFVLCLCFFCRAVVLGFLPLVCLGPCVFAHPPPFFFFLVLFPCCPVAFFFLVCFPRSSGFVPVLLPPPLRCFLVFCFFSSGSFCPPAFCFFFRGRGLLSCACVVRWLLALQCCVPCCSFWWRVFPCCSAPSGGSGAAPPPLPAAALVVCGVFRVFPLLLCCCLFAWRLSGVVAACGDPLPPQKCVCCALYCLVSPRCAGLPSGVLWCPVPVFCAACHAVDSRLAAVHCAVFFWSAFCVLCCVVPCCWLLLCVVLRLWSCRPTALFAMWPAISFRSVLPCAVLCPWVLCCAASLRAVLPALVLLCAMLFCLALFGAAACCVVALGVVRRPADLCLAALCFVVFLCAVAPCYVCFALVSWCVLLFTAVLCAVCDLRCRAVSSLSSPLCAVQGCTVLVRLRCAVCLICAVSGARCCGEWFCFVLFPSVFCGGVLRCAVGCVLCCAAVRRAVSLCGLPCCPAGFGLRVPAWRMGG